MVCFFYFIMTPPLKIIIINNNNNNNNNSVRPSRIKFIVLGLDVISIIFFWTYIRLNAASTGD